MVVLFFSMGILLEDAKIGNGIVQSKYVTISSYHNSYEDAHRFFQSEANTLQSGLDPLRSKSMELDIKERLRIFYDFFHPGEEEHFRFSMKRKMQPSLISASLMLPCILIFSFLFPRCLKHPVIS